MKDFSLLSIYAIAADMFDGWLWLAIIAALVGAIFFAIAWRRQRGFRGRAAGLAIVIGLVVAVGAAAIAPVATQASISSLQRWVDWMALTAIAAGAFVAGTAIAFAALGSLARTA
jgi:nitrogen fixation/metabolism regulation signal transduction histidine kinase